MARFEKADGNIRRASRLMVAITALSAALLLAAAGTASAAEPFSPFGPSISSNKADYAPGEHVVLTGSGWQPGETVSVFVEDDQNKTWSRNVDVTADGVGSFIDEFDLPEHFVATYSVTATGRQSGVARTSFTDAAATLQGQSNPVCTGSAGGCDGGWEPGNLSGWAENDSIPMRVKLTGGFTNEPFQISFDRTLNSSGGTTFGIELLKDFQAGSGVTITTAATACDTTGPVWAYCFRASTSGTTNNANPKFVTFTALMAVGAHKFSGSSMAISGDAPSGMGNVQIAKPAAGQGAPGIPDLKVVKTCIVGCSTPSGPNTAIAGTTVTYRLDYSNLSTTDTGTTVVLRDILGADETFVSCSPSCVDPGGTPRVLSWSFPSLAPGASGFVTLQAQLTSTAGVTVTNEGNITSPQVDSNNLNNVSTLATTTQNAPPAIHATSTSVACSPNPVTYGSTASCTATVSDTAASGRTAPTGTVTVNNDVAAGTFSSSTCTLGSPTASSSSCVVTYTPTAVGTGTHVISASYGADSTHTGSTGTTNLTVQKASLTGHFTAADKEYNGLDGATITGRTLTGVISGDTVSLTGGTATFNTPNVGTGKTVTGTGFALTGASAGNYSLASSTLTTTADITAKQLTGHFTAADKEYNGLDGATITGRTLTGVISGDTVSLTGGAATFNTPNVGTGKTVTGTGFALTGASAGNYSLASSTLTTTADITAKQLTGHFTAANKEYNGLDGATITGRTLTGVITGDTVSLTGGTATFNTPNVGTGKTVTGTGFALTGGSAGNYSLASSTLTTTADITAKQLTGHFTAADKEYNGLDGAVITGRTLTGVISGDTVSLTGGTATFNTPNVGTGKTVTGTGFSLTGGSAGNYSLASSTLTTTADITAKQLTGHFTAADKEYNGLDGATITGRTLTGVISGDTVSLTGGTATFNTPNVGTGKTVTGTGFALTGGSAGNYSLASSTLTTTADITAKQLTGHFTAANKEYNGLDGATITGRTLTGVISGDTVSLTGGTATFNTPNVGTGKTVTGTGFTLAGTSAGNYSLASSTLTTTADITAKQLTGHFTAADKEYNGLDGATITGRTLTGVITGDTVSLTGGAATFNTPNVGTGKTVTGTGFTLTGTSAGNYSLASSTLTTTADITAKQLTGHFTAANKEYNGLDGATITGRTLTGVISGDTVSLTGGAATFNTPNVGTGKTVTATGFTLTGASAGNYSLASSTLTTTADITAKQLTGHFTAANKEYNGLDGATITGRTLTGVITGDTVSLTGGTATFNTPNVGTGKTVTGTGFTLTGTSAGNYSLASSTLTTTADITAKQLTGHFTAADKEYNGLDGATITGRTLTGVITGDTVSLTGGAATFNTPNVGTGKTVTGTGFTLTGTSAGNYSLASSTLTTTADITAKQLTGHFTAADKEYNGLDGAVITDRSLTGGIITGDTVSLTGGAATFNTPNVGTGKTVTGTGFALTGGSAGNYSLASSTLTTTADITAKQLTGHFTAANKEYNGLDGATITGRTLTGVISGDTVSLTGGTATFNTPNVGTGKTVTGTGFTLTGTSAGNYSLASSTLTTTADITAKQLTGHFTAADKEYNGLDGATITGRTLTGVISGDTVSLTGGTATFNTPNVGTGKTVTGTGFTLTGTSAGNYSLASSTLTTTADITAKQLTGHFTAANKEYNGLDGATITGRTLTGVITGDTVSLTGGAATFNTPNVGTGKTVTGTGFTLTGTSAGNYSLASSTLTTTADITAKQLTGHFTAANKEYNGLDGATITGRTLTGVITGDTVSLTGGAATFNTPNVGTGKTVTGTGFTLTGTSAGNYSLASSTLTTTADITAKQLTGHFTAADKEYNGLDGATITGRTLTGVITGDTVSLTGGAATFNTPNVGTGKTVTGTGFTLTGTSAGNYSLASSTLTTTADITAKQLTGHFTAANKEYNGLDGATITDRSLTGGIITGDTVSLTGGTATFNTPNVGTGKTVTGTGFTLTGASAGNYSLAATTLTTTADITKATLSVNADSKSVPFGQSPTLTYTLSGFKNGETAAASSANVTGTAACTVASTAGPGVGIYTNTIACQPGTLAALNYSFVEGSKGTLTITQASTTTTYSGDVTKQYSDVAQLKATLVRGATPLDGRTVKFTIGSQETTAVTNASGVAVTTLRIDQSPAIRSVVTSWAGDANHNGSTDTDQFTVTQEDAAASYTGPMFQFTPSISTGTVTVPLRATIQDPTALPTTDPRYDASAGDIRNASVKFVAREAGGGYTAGQVICTATLTLIDAADPKTATAACPTSPTFTIPGDSDSFSVGIVVGNYYLSDAATDNTVITISKPIATQFITGGGYLLLDGTSAGTHKGDAGSKNNFGFNVKYNSRGTNLQGRLNTIIRRGGRVYQVKANNLGTLGVSYCTATAGAITGACKPAPTAPCTTNASSTCPIQAVFSGQASISDVTNPTTPISIEGGATVQMDMVDWGEPGSNGPAGPDQMGITVWTKTNALWYSSRWNGTKTLMQLLNGGNLVVH